MPAPWPRPDGPFAPPAGPSTTTMAAHSAPLPPIPPDSPFHLDNEAGYRAWRAAKLARAAACRPAPVAIADPWRPDPAALARLQAALAAHNFALYALPAGASVDKAWLLGFARRFGLVRLDSNLCADEDSVSALRVVREGRPRDYIPYSDRPLNWHTDGYYNPPAQRIRSFVLHCVQQAARGGGNGLIDHERLYIALRDRDPQLVRALMAPDAMTIPANREGGRLLRPRQSGPVFSVDPLTGCLHMRYTARTRHIAWRDDPATRAATAALRELLADPALVTRWRLQPGQGLLANNVLHCRDGFRDAPGQRRLLLRARFFDRIRPAAPAGAAPTEPRNEPCSG